MIIRVTAEDLRNPFESRVLKCHIEPALDCEGVVCGISNGILEDGTFPEVDPHWHLVVWGDEPKTSPRYVPFFGKPPDVAQFVSFGPADSPPTF